MYYSAEDRVVGVEIKFDMAETWTRDHQEKKKRYPENCYSIFCPAATIPKYGSLFHYILCIAFLLTYSF